MTFTFFCNTKTITMRQALLFTLKVWLTTLLLVPIPMLMLQYNVGWTASHYLTVYSWLFLGETVSCSPLIIIFLFFTFWVNNKTWLLKKKKFLIFLQAEILFLIASVLWMRDRFNLYELEVSVIYAAIIGLGVLVYRLENKQTA